MLDESDHEHDEEHGEEHQDAGRIFVAPTILQPKGYRPGMP